MPSSNPFDAHLSQITGIGWMARELHNLALSIYMADPTDDTYRGIVGHMQNALDEISARSVNGWGCPNGWCPDERDRCRPCENGDGD